jgi:uncharacterized delta-60 repeat protein
MCRVFRLLIFTLLVAAVAAPLAAFAPDVDGEVTSLAVQGDGKIVIGGSFTTVNGVARKNLARLNADSSLDTSFDPGSGPFLIVHSVAVQGDGKVLIGGLFTTVNGISRSRVARLNADGSVDAGFDPGVTIDNRVNVLAPAAGGKVYIGGSFTAIGTASRNCFARLNSDGSLDTGFDPGTGVESSGFPFVLAIAVQPDGKVLIGGSFETVDRTARNSIARLDNDGSLDATFDPGAGPSGQVRCILRQGDGKLLVGGQFFQWGTEARGRIARLEADGALDLTFNPSANNDVNALTLLANGQILLAGDFTAVNGNNAGRVARVSPNGTLDVTFLAWPGVTGGRVATMGLHSGDRPVIGGTFTQVDAEPRNRVARLNGDGSVDTSPPPVVTGVSPDPVMRGEQLTITGTELDPALSVTIGGTPATIQGNNATTIVVAVGSLHPLGANQVVAVPTAGGTDSSATVTVEEAPIAPPGPTGPKPRAGSGSCAAAPPSSASLLPGLALFSCLMLFLKLRKDCDAASHYRKRKRP